MQLRKIPDVKVRQAEESVLIAGSYAFLTICGDRACGLDLLWPRIWQTGRHHGRR